MFRSSADHHHGAYLILVKITYLKFQSSCVVNLVMRQHKFIRFTCCRHASTHSASNRNEYQGYFLGVKAAGA
jgi:hypothetical protein